MRYEPLCDYENPIVQKTAKALSKGLSSKDELIEKLFYYVRDDIKFGFFDEGDNIKASEIIERGKGQCNNKSLLFLALCKALGVEARIHFSLANKDIQKGLFRGLMFKLLPAKISHSWIDIKTGEDWVALDAYINDIQYFRAAKSILMKEKLDMGYSVACSGGKSSADFSKDGKQFVQMAAVVEDQGVYDEPADYYNSEKYRNKPGFIKNIVYKIYIKSVNRRIESLRQTCSSGLCGN
jgi:hypothetical protein